MSRRHLFDNGFPVTGATLLIGREDCSHIEPAHSRESRANARLARR